MKLAPFLIICLLALTFSQENPVSLEKRRKLVYKLREYMDKQRRGSTITDLVKEMTSRHALTENTIEATKEGIEKFIIEKGSSYTQDFIKYIRASMYVDEGAVYHKLLYDQQYFTPLDDMVETLGSCIKDNGHLYVVFIKSVVKATRIILKIRIILEKCKKTWFFFRKCWKIHEDTPTGYSARDIQEIKNTMIAKCSEMCKIALTKIDLSK